jgi:uncharacterized protein
VKLTRVKLASRSGWKRVTKRKFGVWKRAEENFTGYVTRLDLLEVTSPLWVNSCGERVCIADKGYSWLQHFPEDTHYTLTSQWDNTGGLVQWYFDICECHDVDDNGIPYWDDLYLDVIGSPNNIFEILDQDELANALEQKHISLEQYELAVREADTLLRQLNTEKFKLLEVAKGHYKKLTIKDSVQVIPSN